MSGPFQFGTNEGINMATVLVTGGTGTLGRLVVHELMKIGQQARILTRNANSAVPSDVQVSVSNLADRSSLNEATQGIDSIIHCASNPAKATEDIDGTRALLECAASNGVRYFVYISIVGVDRADAPYYKTKHTVEQIVRGSDIPSVILRATQFHSFVAGLIQKLDVDTLDEVLVPAGVRLQTIEAEEVAQRLAELTKTKQTGYVDDVGGPEILAIEDMVKDFLVARGRQATVRSVDPKGSPWVAWTGEAHLCPKHRYGKVTWQQFLCSEYGSA